MQVFMKHSRSNRLILVSMALRLVFVDDAALAFRFQPMVFDLDPEGAKAERTLTVENTTNQTLTLDITAEEIRFSKDGVEQNQPADDDFIIFPPTAIVQPSQTQAVRIRYIGEPDIAYSKSYRVSVNQVPVDLKGTGVTAIGIVVNFAALANVVPEGALAEPSAESIEAGRDEAYWTVTLRNSGNRYVRLSDTDWILVSGSGQKLELSGAEVDEIVSGNLLPPQSIREFRIDTSGHLDGFAPESTNVVINMK